MFCCHAATGMSAPVCHNSGPVGMVWIISGEFLMGSDVPMFRDARPKHRVVVDGFWIDATEVNNSDFARFVNSVFQ